MKSCHEFEMEIMDAAFGEKAMSAECQVHLATCQACQSFYRSLSVLPEPLMEESAVDEYVVGQAVKAALKIRQQKNEFERRVFLIASLGLTGLCLALVYNGFGLLFRNLYLGIYLIGPLALPLIIWKRQSGGREHA
jgi:predicted anti-sigma-YlaC factor YlaD